MLLVSLVSDFAFILVMHFLVRKKAWASIKSISSEDAAMQIMRTDAAVLVEIRTLLLANGLPA